MIDVVSIGPPTAQFTIEIVGVVIAFSCEVFAKVVAANAILVGSGFT
jgi:hypothetical protein